MKIFTAILIFVSTLGYTASLGFVSRMYKSLSWSTRGIFQNDTKGNTLMAVLLGIQLNF